MSHQLEQMAYVGESPWHGLGNSLSPNQPLEVWAEQAGMNWEIKESPVHFMSDTVAHLSSINTFPEQKVLFRSDTQQALSVVSQRYQVVQPHDVLEFYRDLTNMAGFKLETAGVLKGGKKFWALAKTGQSMALKSKDQVHSYLLLATSCDGTLATTATPTTIRVVCNNTLSIAVNGATQAIKVPHSTRFDPQVVNQQLGVAVSQWDSFMYQMRTLSERKITSHEALNYFQHVLCDVQPAISVPSALPNKRALAKVQNLYSGHGRGSELEAAKDSAWGLLNAVTEYIDHEKRARSVEHRIDSAWFGQGATVKQRALTSALQLVA